ncbi:MAG: AAA family ATPase [Gaiellaceae bacterium MAG52_C11]|nr:AAA family ATPase [Candidatus Gaiellasilicea maunaloa]
MAVEIVGREDEVAALHAFFERASLEGGARPAAVVLEGEAGIGKSTLWQAGVEIARKRSLRVLSARPSEAEQGLAYAALGDLLEACPPDVLPELSAPRRRALEAALLLDGGDGSPADPRALAVAVHGVLAALAERGAIVIAVDDVQWLDSSSADALSYALRRLDREPVRVLVARRRDQVSALERALPGGIERLPVGSLSLGAIQGVVRDRLGRTFPRPTMLRLYEVSGGNPFFALELARALAAAAAPLDPAQPLPVPESLEHLVGERLRALPEETRAALLVVAIIGAPAQELVEAAGIAGATLAPAVAADALEHANGEVRFVHPLLASGVIAEATDAERRGAHRLVATVVDEPVARARHVAAALEAPDGETATLLEDTAELARSRGAPSVAAELGEAAARATPPDAEDDRRRRVVRSARDYLAAGLAERGFVLAHELLEHASPGPARAEALALLGDLEDVAGEIQAAVEYIREALRESGGRPELALLIHERLALTTRVSEELVVAEKHAREAVRLGEQLGDDALAARSLATLAVVRFNQGEPESFPLAQRAVELAARSGDARAIDDATGAWGHCLLWSGRIDEARHVFTDRLCSLADRDEPGVADALWYLALVEERAGRLELAREHAERSRELNLQYAWREQDEPAVHHPLARTAAYQGDEQLARELAERGYAYAEVRGGMSTGRAQLALLGILDHWTGEPARALERFEAFDAQRQAAGFSSSIAIHLADHVEALLEVGRPAEALSLLDGWESEARKLGYRWAIPEIRRCRGLVAANEGDVAAGIVLLEEAVPLHEEVGDPFGRARALLLLGVTRRRSRQKRSARAAIESALAGFEEIGAAGWAEKARAELGSIGGRKREEGLTPAERRVAALVAEGRTNREVAAALFLGERTVETHLSHVYAKLGIRSRTELARTLH